MQLDYSHVFFILQGIKVTLSFTSLSLILGLFIAIILNFMTLSEKSFLKISAKAYISVFRGTPLLVQLWLTYYAIPQLIDYKISVFEAGILAFSLNSGAYIAEVIRSGIEAVPVGQFEAASSLGISYFNIMKDIIFPQAVKNILPALVNEMINLLKESALISTLGGGDLWYRATIVAAEKFIYFEPYLWVAATYYMMVMFLSICATRLEQRLSKND